MLAELMLLEYKLNPFERWLERRLGPSIARAKNRLNPLALQIVSWTMTCTAIIGIIIML